jgi:hypothetical protein
VSASFDPRSAIVDRVMAVVHAPATTRIVLIGHHTLPLLIGLLRRGCASVRTMRPDLPAGDHAPADLVWIVDTRGEQELDTALREARQCAGANGRIVAEATALPRDESPAAFRNHARAFDLVVTFVEQAGRRFVLSPAAPLASAA